MNSQMKYKVVQKLFLSFVIVGILINFATQKVYACTPAPETPWFIPSVSLISTNLPETAIEIEPADNALLLKNISDIPIRVVVSGSYQDKNGYYELAKGQSAPLQVNYFDDLNPDKLEIDYYLITPLEHRNVYADNRPENIKVPEPQIAWVQLLIHDQSYYMQLEVSYAINPYYRPDSVYAYGNACINWNNQILFGGLVTPLAGFVLLVSLAVVTVSVIFIIKLRKRQ